MPDPRFFSPPEPVTLAVAVEVSGARLADGVDPARLVRSVAPLSLAGPEDATFLAGRRKVEDVPEEAGACFVTEDAAAALGGRATALLIHPEPQAAFVALARRLYPDVAPEAGVHPGAHVAGGASLAAGCRVEAGAVIEAGAEIGEGCWIGAGAVIGRGVVLGPGCRIGPRAVLTHAILAAGVIVHAGAAIGQDGFGYLPGPGGLTKIPQLGRVVIGDGVEIGANTTIDRGSGEDTVIGEGTKIDNLVQIAHNCRIGRHCVIVSHVGLSGSVEVGDGAMLGGKVGVADHVKIGRGAQVAAGSGVMKDVPDGAIHAGSPAKPVKDWHRETVILKRLREGRGPVGGDR